MVFRFQNKQAICGIRLLSKMRIFFILTTLLILTFSMAEKFPPSVISGQTTITPIGVTKSIFDLPYRLCWSYLTDQINVESIASDNANQIYVSNLTGGVTAINVSDGEKVWQTELGGSVISNILPDAGAKDLYVITKKKISMTIGKHKTGTEKAAKGQMKTILIH